MAIKLFEQGNHLCVAFTDLVRGKGIQSNQFIIIDNQHKAILDPGGDLTFTPLSIQAGIEIDIQETDYIFASHQDPDIIASMDHWLMHTRAKVICSRLWTRFLPHLIPGYLESEIEGRIIGIPDQGKLIPFGDTYIVALPAHFLHSVGNLHFYDPISKILFSGDLGASLVDEDTAHEFIETQIEFEHHIKAMEGFHRRYMCGNKACKLWANMVRGMQVDMIVPQHGRPFKGSAITAFLDWISDLRCGIDILTQEHYKVPKE